MEITKDTTILALLENHPEAREVLISLGLKCLGCLGAEHETVEIGARMHGLAVDEVLRPPPRPGRSRSGSRLSGRAARLVGTTRRLPSELVLRLSSHKLLAAGINTAGENSY